MFTPRAQAVLWTIGVAIALALVLGAAALNRAASETAARAIVRQAPGILVPGAVFAALFWITWALYRRFSRKAH